MDLWFRQLGFWNNPFSIKPAAFSNEVFGNNTIIEDVINNVNAGNILFVEGDYGQGKTTLLKRLIKEFGGQKKLIYYSCNRTESLIDMDELIKGRLGFWGKLFSGKSNDLILFLDEAQDLSREDLEVIYDFYVDDNFKSILFVGSDLKKVPFTKEFKDLISERIFKMKKITPDEAVQLVRKRIGNIPLMSDKVIKLIYAKSDYNPRKLLKNCEIMCKYAVDNIEDEVTEEMVKEVLE